MTTHLLPSARRAQEQIARERERLLTKARAEVAAEDEINRARHETEAAEARAWVEVHRARRAEAEAMSAARSSQESEDDMAKAKTISKPSRGSTDYPKTEAHYAHMHHTQEGYKGPTHLGVARGDELKTSCGKTLGLKYWRVVTTKVTCADCLGDGGKKNGHAAGVKVEKRSPFKARPNSAASKRGQVGKGAPAGVKNYTGKAKTKKTTAATPAPVATAVDEATSGK